MIGVEVDEAWTLFASSSWLEVLDPVDVPAVATEALADEVSRFHAHVTIRS